jgi:hypothetical protein
LILLKKKPVSSKLSINGYSSLEGGGTRCSDRRDIEIEWFSSNGPDVGKKRKDPGTEASISNRF